MMLTNLAPALLKARAAFDPVLKDATNPHFRNKYASLSAVLGAVDGALSENGISVLQFPADGAHGPGLTTMLLHESGEHIQGTTSIPLSKTDPQGWAAGITYARRYGLMAVLGIAAEDDDGNAATAAKAAPKSANTPAGRRKTLAAKVSKQLGIAKPSKDQIADHLGIEPSDLDDDDVVKQILEEGA